MANGKFGVLVQVGTKRPDLVIVGSGANIASALRAKKLDPASFDGKLTLNDKAVSDLTTRLHTNDLLAVIPDVAGGSN